MSTEGIAEIYNIAHWGDGYFDISAQGQVRVLDHELHHQVVLQDIVNHAQQQGLQLPLLVRFPHILHDRVKRLHQAFAEAIHELEYQGEYTPVYPVKVNQQRRVIEEIIQGQLKSLQPARLGLEAGTKPELLAVMTEAHLAPATIICNGYKDESYIELALIAEKLGHQTFIVIEKSGELELVLKVAERLRISPRIGFRSRLASVGKGYWQNTGGEKSKFGLTAQEIVNLVNKLQARGQLSCLQLLHFHLGSQIANIADIQRGLQECSHFYTELMAMGANIQWVDVGGGLGVDYEGTRSRSLCSINYSLKEYARAVVQAFAAASREMELPCPNIVTESGRAVTAHHAVLITNTVDQENKVNLTRMPLNSDHVLIDELLSCQLDLDSRKRSLTEIYHQITQVQDQAKQLFCLGQLRLQERADIENLSGQLLAELKKRLDVGKRNHAEIFNHLNEVLADKLFVNFSVFQSLPDVWGLEQIFPIMPLNYLNRPITQRAVIQDITCDSDGRIDLYVDGEGVESTLPMPQTSADEEILLGFFMVGAYQEILGDMHNLFGDTDSVDAYFDDQGALQLKHGRKGDTMAAVLKYVDFDPEVMMRNFTAQVKRSSLSDEQRQDFLTLVQESFEGRTYLS
ncbi:biosynthetic arginine decarboxylase [Gynuella sunshinyii]|uniref:Arginine decarboxylase n=1 Tax=Gynuella sunshinyii YC6258 TaxID=1445510 RepID=A0A0C5VFJ4_9GAMM|nr:biosynthetic arginine decarboxylase [Gynuella sunshinyii]AJQ92951.1 arginine decarboxylase (spermidine biosynthesis) [Gynuella sunshinyii YC6258]